MQNPKECCCCNEIQACLDALNDDVVLAESDDGKPPPCITQHPAFQVMCLDRWALRMAADRYKTRNFRRYIQIGSEERYNYYYYVQKLLVMTHIYTVRCRKLTNPLKKNRLLSYTSMHMLLIKLTLLYSSSRTLLQQDEFFSRFLRSIAYRQFTRLVHGRIGNHRIPLPACAYSIIRTTFQTDEQLTGYQEDSD